LHDGNVRSRCVPGWRATLPYYALKDLLIHFAHLLTAIVELMGPCGAKAVAAGSYPDSTESGINFLPY